MNWRKEKMRTEDWELAHEHLYELLNAQEFEMQYDLEQKIISAYAQEYNLNEALAERQLAQKGRIFAQPNLALAEKSFSQLPPKTEEEKTAGLKVITKLGEKALEEFNNRPSVKIYFPNANLDFYTYFGWVRTPLHPELNYYLLKEKFNQSQSNFELFRVELKGGRNLSFYFKYKDLINRD
jgi:hypothetical protein